MAIIRVETTTFRNHTVRAGFDYDNVSNLVVGFWCVNNSNVKMTMVVPNMADSSKRVTSDFPPNEERVDPKVVGQRVTFVDGAPVLPFGLESRYSWG